MRALFLLFLAPLVGCQAIVGSYEIGETDSGARDTAVADSASTDSKSDAVDSGGLVVKSCKQYYAEETTHSNGTRMIVAVGSPGYPSGVSTFCDMDKGQGATMVAVRRGSTNGTVWAGFSGVAKSRDFKGPEDDVDAVLDIDWRLLGFTDVIYEIGVPTSGSPRPPRTRVNFRGLTSTFQDIARDSLSLERVPMTGVRPNCTVDNGMMMGTTSYMECIQPMGADTGVRSPAGSLGWAFAPNGIECFWAYKGSNGTQDCINGAPGAGRVFVK
jgi:hypothetical protein